MSKKLIVVLVVLYVFAAGFGNFVNLTLKSEQAKVENAFAAEQVPQLGAQTSDEVIIIKMTIGNSTIYVNGRSTTVDVAPTIVESRTLLPIRWVAEPLGATVNWESTTKKVTVTLNNTTIELWIGKNTARVNGMSKQIDPGNPKVVPLIINGRTMLPVRFISENLGCIVSWDATLKLVTIGYTILSQNKFVQQVIEPNKDNVIKLKDGAQVTIPAGSISETSVVILGESEQNQDISPDFNKIGQTYVIKAGTELNKTVTIKVPISSANNNPIFILHTGDNGSNELILAKRENNFAIFDLSSFSTITPINLNFTEKNTSFDVHKYGFHFENPYSADVYYKCNKTKYTGGVCWGMAAVSLGYCYKNNIETPKATEFDDLPCKWKVLIGKAFDWGNNKFYNFNALRGNLLQIWNDITFGYKESYLSSADLYKLISSFTNLATPQPVMLDLLGYETLKGFFNGNLTLQKNVGHAVVAYAIKQFPQGTEGSSTPIIRVYIYDPNLPDNTNRYFDVELYDAKNGLFKLVQPYSYDPDLYFPLIVVDDPPPDLDLSKYSDADCNSFSVSPSDNSFSVSLKAGETVEKSFKLHTNCSISKMHIILFGFDETAGYKPLSKGGWVALSPQDDKADTAYYEYNNLLPNDDKNFEIKISPPSNLKTGTYKFELSVICEECCPIKFESFFAVEVLPNVRPDLVVDSISWTPTSPKEGDSVTFTANIKNIGQADATNFNTKLYVGGNLIDTKNISTLAAGSSTSITFTNKWTATSGCQDVKVVVDSDNTVQESDENNNTLTNQICPEVLWSIIDNQNDLIGTGTILNNAFSFSKIGYHGDYLGTDCLSAYVQNDNSVTFTVKRYLLGNMNTFKWYAYSASFETGSINIVMGKYQDSTYSHYTEFTQSLISTINDDYDYNLDGALDIISASIYYRSDLDSYVFNIKTRSLPTLTGRFAWYFYIWDSTHTYRIGLFYYPQWYNKINYNWKDKWGISIATLKDQYPYGNDAYYDILSSSVAIENADTLRLTMKVAGQIPQSQLDVMPTYGWGFDIDNDPKTGYYANGSEVWVKVGYDNGWKGKLSKIDQEVSIEGLSCSVSGDTIIVRVSLSQIGLSPSRPFKWYSSSSVWVLNKDMQKDFSVLGCYDWGYIGIKDMAPDIGTISIENKPDILVENLTWDPVSPKEGDAVTFTAKLKNQGQVPVTNSFNVSLYIGNSLFDTKTINTLAVGSSANVTFKTWTGVAGNNDVKVVADSSNSIIESNEDNNTNTNELTIQGQSSIKVLSPNGGEKLKVGSKFTINWQADGVYLGTFGIFYSIDGGKNWILIAYTSIVEGTSYNWVIPNNVSNNCVIFVGHSYNGKWLSSDKSDNSFSIIP